MRGYSQNIVEANELADSLNIGVLLGRICIPQKYPVTSIAKELGVSRQAVYDWFLGRTKPSEGRIVQIAVLIHSITNKP